MFNVAPYQFLEWKEEAFCCGDYVSLVLYDYFGIELSPVRHAGGPIAAAKALRATNHRRLFRPIREPKDFCVVEMQQFKSPDHVGLYVIIAGEPMITHCVKDSGVLLSTIKEVQESYKIIGYYEYVGSSV